MRADIDEFVTVSRTRRPDALWSERKDDLPKIVTVLHRFREHTKCKRNGLRTQFDAEVSQ